jgi:hypothetical protein
LGLDLVDVDLARLIEGCAHRPLGDLIEHHTVELGLRSFLELLVQMPADRLTLAVGVGRQIDRVGRLGFTLELVERLLLFR